MTHLAEPKILKRCHGKTTVLDTETTGLRWWVDEIIGVAVHCPEEDIAAYIPTLTNKDREETFKAIRELPPTTTLLNHNIKFDLHFMRLDPEPYRILDTTVMVHLIDSRFRKALADCEKVFLGTDSKRHHVTEAPKRKKIHEWPLEVVADYAINDTLVTYQLAETLWPRIEEMGLEDLFFKDMEYLKLLWKIEERGILLDTGFIVEAKGELQKHLSGLERELYDSVGYKFNWRSHKQLSKALYDDMGISRPINPFADADGVDRSRFADTGKYNSTMTSTFILMEKAKHPLGELVSTIRETAKLMSTLTQWTTEQDKNGAVHTTFNLTGTRTGRLSSSKPNIQNVPSFTRNRFTQGVYTGGTERTEEYNLRNAFIARAGYRFIAVDWRQMEMRMFGILSGDPFMLDSLASGRDVHADIAEAVWGVRDKVHREWSKTISFGLIYGMTTGSLQFKLNLTPQRAREITEQYWSTFPRIRPWLFGTVDQCKQNLNLRYWSGRYWWEEAEQFMYRGANAMIQGGCADILSIAALRVDRWFEDNPKVDGRIISLVHDEIISEVKAEFVEQVVTVKQEIMLLPDLFNIPWFNDARVGLSYGSLENYTKDTNYGD